MLGVQHNAFTAALVEIPSGSHSAIAPGDRFTPQSPPIEKAPKSADVSMTPAQD